MIVDILYFFKYIEYIYIFYICMCMCVCVCVCLYICNNVININVVYIVYRAVLCTPLSCYVIVFDLQCLPCFILAGHCNPYCIHHYVHHSSAKVHL